MPRLTVQEVKEQHGGILPHDATLRGDDESEFPPSLSHASKAKPGADTTATATATLKRRGRSARFAALNAFVDFGIATAGLTPAEALTWLILYRDTKGDGIARTAQSDIARRAGLSVRGVKKAVQALTAKGLLDVVRRGRLNDGPSTYRVHPTGRTG